MRLSRGKWDRKRGLMIRWSTSTTCIKPWFLGATAKLKLWLILKYCHPTKYDYNRHLIRFRHSTPLSYTKLWLCPMVKKLLTGEETLTHQSHAIKAPSLKQESSALQHTWTKHVGKLGMILFRLKLSWTISMKVRQGCSRPLLKSPDQQGIYHSCKTIRRLSLLSSLMTSRINSGSIV